MKLYGELYQPNVGLINVGVPEDHRGAEHGIPEYLTGEMDAREAAIACDWLGLQYAIPCHHDDPGLPQIVEFNNRLTQARSADPAKTEPVILKPGEAFTLTQPSPDLSPSN
jgi:L-ascorbate metabolism protein UlaG (beta-lactamase superfamily)